MKIQLVVVAVQLLYVNGVFFSQTFQYGGLVELLTGAKFFYNTGFFEFSLEFLRARSMFRLLLLVLRSFCFVVIFVIT